MKALLGALLVVGLASSQAMAQNHKNAGRVLQDAHSTKFHVKENKTSGSEGGFKTQPKDLASALKLLSFYSSQVGEAEGQSGTCTLAAAELPTLTGRFVVSYSLDYANVSRTFEVNLEDQEGALVAAGTSSEDFGDGTVKAQSYSSSYDPVAAKLSVQISESSSDEYGLVEYAQPACIIRY